MKEYFKEITADLYLRQKLKKSSRNIKVCSLKDSNKIGIIFDATYPVNFNVIRDFVKKLTNEAKDVHVLGYVDSEELIDHYLYRKGFQFFTRKDLNWFNKPSGENVDSFITKEFDILINLSLEHFYAIDYIVALSNARFKIGKLFEGDKYLDVMIDLEKELKTFKAVLKEVKETQSDKPTSHENESLKPDKLDKKTSLEIQLNFLIQQTEHYLNLFGNKKGNDK